MPSLNLDENKSAYQIHAYQPGMLQINEQKLTASVIITPNQLITDWAPQRISEVNAASFEAIIAIRPDILLIGTGSKHVFLPIELYGELINLGIGVEMMDTAAACRTFNALSAEDRNVAAALIIC
jgi:uncharacterized protein